MNLLGVDFGQKNIGTAICIQGVIQPHKIYPNNSSIFTCLQDIISDYKVQKIILGYTQSKNLKDIKKFQKAMETELHLPVELVDENLSTREAEAIVKTNRNYKKKYLKEPIDSQAAAVLLSRYV